MSFEVKATGWGEVVSPLGFITVLATTAVLALSPVMQNLDSRWSDFEFCWWRSHNGITAEDTVRVVGIDDRDLKEIGVPIALLHRQLSDFLAAMVVAQPKAVGLDVLLPDRSYDELVPGLDAMLARGIVGAKRSFPLVLGVGADADGKPRELHPLFARMAGEDGLGFILTVNDADGTVRRFDEHLGSGGQDVPTLSGQIARALHLEVRTGAINYLVGDTFSYIPLRDVLRWKRDGDDLSLRQAFAGKIVLLGSTLAYDDLHYAPIPLSNWLPEDPRSNGVLLHAQQLRTLLTGSILQPLPLSLTFVLSLVLALSWFLRPWWGSWLLIAATIAAIVTLGLLLLRAGWILPSMTLSCAVLLGLGGRTGLVAWNSSRERRRLRATFDGFVSPGVLKEILSGNLAPNAHGERRDVCVMFSDIRGFTTLSESLPPETVTSLLNRYFERMTTAVHSHGGTLDKFIGDGLMAFFGAPQAATALCQDALAAACDMVVALDEFNIDQRRMDLPEVSIGIGLHFGPAIIGYVGSKERHEYSAIGDTVNSASRIEGLTKGSGYPVFMSDTFYERLADKRGIVEIGSRAVKGRSAIVIYGWRPE